jgi:hypothetical protein
MSTFHAFESLTPSNFSVKSSPTTAELKEDQSGGFLQEITPRLLRYRALPPRGIEDGEEFAVSLGQQRSFVQFYYPPSARRRLSSIHALNKTLPKRPATYYYSPLHEELHQKTCNKVDDNETKSDNFESSLSFLGLHGTAQVYKLLIPPNVGEGKMFTIQIKGHKLQALRLAVKCMPSWSPGIKIHLVFSLSALLRTYPSPAVVRQFLSRYPTSTRMSSNVDVQDSFALGRLPLHSAVGIEKLDWETIDVVLENFPDAAHVQDKTGNHQLQVLVIKIGGWIIIATFERK